ncbi:MAG TPA: IPT/TIG domain-containing protein [Gaiellaceae bacterium]|nr:IPT/TIG domain-containing protein [Gaiellaceae bacterium]
MLFCAAASSSGITTTGNPTGGASDWTATDLGAAYQSVDCMSSVFCVAGDDQGDIATSTNPGTGSASDWSVDNVDGTSSITGVSCPGADLCVAVDAAGEVVVGTSSSGGSGGGSAGSSGPSWTQTPAVTPGPGAAWLRSVSCYSTTGCVAVGDQGTPAGLIERWNGTRWSLKSSPAVSDARDVTLTGVSCASSSWCVAAGYEEDSFDDYLPVIEDWDGSSWTLPPLPTVNRDHSSSEAPLDAVSCASASTCVAVGDYTGSSFGYYAFSLVWDGSSWTESDPPSPGSNYTIPDAISCASGASSCVSVGSYSSGGSQRALALDWSSSGGWSLDNNVGQGGATNNSLVTITCLTATSCVAAGAAHSFFGNPGSNGLTVQTWDGSTWTTAVDGSSGGGAASIACSSTTDCLIVGAQGSGPETTFAETFDGSTFSAAATPSPGGGATLSSLACPGDCFAVGEYTPLDGSSNDLTNAALALTTGSGPFPPAVDAVSPAAGGTDGGTTVTIDGDGFTGATNVAFGGVAASFSVNNDDSITATAPNCSCSGATADVTVTTGSGTSTSGNVADQFTYAGVPTVTSISPTSGLGDGSTTVDISGTNLSGATGVSFGSASASFSVDSNTEIEATAPAGSGTVDVTVTSAAGTSATSSADEFTYVVVPAVSSVSPDHGADTGGTIVTIHGSGFTGATRVELDCDNDESYDATTFTVVSDTEIDATTPAPLVGRPAHVDDPECDFEVTGPNGTSQDVDGDLYSYEQVDFSTITVTRFDDPAGDGDCPDDCSLRQALAAVDDEGTVLLPAGTYTLTQGQLLIDQDVSLVGDSARTTTIEQTGRQRVLEVQSGDAQLSALTITGGNTRSGGEPNEGVGGGAWIDGSGELDLDDVTVTGNTAYQSGGGIDVNGTLDVYASTISDNSVSGGLGIGGGIDDFGQEVDVENSTIADNNAAVSGGGALLASNATLLNDTIAGNAAPTASSVFVYGSADVQATNTIFDGVNGSNCNAPVYTQGGNITSDTTCWGEGQSGDLIATDPQLGPLEDDGGDTDTLTPRAGSPAIDNGKDSACPEEDQIGTQRPQGPDCDTGSVEVVQTQTTATLTVTTSGAGTVTADDSSIDCPGTCSATYPAGSVVTLTATPATGQTFSGWTGDCTGTTTCTVTLSTDADVTATFAAAAPAQPELHIDGAQQIVSGGTGLEPVVVEDKLGPLAGPSTLSIDVPRGRASVTKIASGWSCPTTAASLVVCTTNATLQPGANVTAVTLTLSAAGLAAGSTETLSAQLTNGVDTATTSSKTTVTPAQVPMLMVGIRQVLSVVDTQGGAAVVNVTNVGRAPTSTGDSVTIPAIAGATIASTAGDGWSCAGAGGAGTLTCHQAGSALPGTRLPPLLLRLTSTDAQTTQVRVSATATDAASPRTASGVGVLALLHTVAPVLALRSTLAANARVAPGGTLSYALAVANTGTAPETGDLELTYSFPAGAKVIATPASGSGWKCNVSATAGQPVSLVCDRPASNGTLAPGHTSPPVAVAVHLPAELGTGTLTLSGHASSGVLSLSGVLKARRLSATIPYTDISVPVVSSETADNVAVTDYKPPQLPPPPADGIAVHTTLGDPSTSSAAPLQRGESGYLVVDVTNSSGADQANGATVGLQLPAGITPPAQLRFDSEEIGVHPTKQKSKKKIVPVISCSNGTPARGSGSTSYLCSDRADLPAGEGFEVSFQVNVATTVPDAPNVVAGVMASGATLQDVTNGNFQSWSQQLPLSVTGIQAVAQLAGEPQAGSTVPEVASLIRKTDSRGNPAWKANTITLDGSKSSGTGAGPLTYVWAELSGPPAVSPVGAAAQAPNPAPAGIAPPAGATVFYGEQPQVQLPPVQTTSPQPFVFELWVTDGTRVDSTTTTVDVDPAPEQAPVITAMGAKAGGTTVVSYTAPPESYAPGYGQNTSPAPHAQPTPRTVAAGTCVTVSVGAHSPEGSALTWSFNVNAPGAPPTPVAVGNDAACPQGSGNVFTFDWPTGYSMLEVDATVTDGRGGTTSHSLSIGPPPSPLVLSASLPASFPSTGAVPGTQYTLTVTPHGASDPSSLTYSWTPGACSGSSGSLAATVVSSSGTNALVTVPAARTAGTSVPVCVSTTQGGQAAGTVTATIQIPLAAPAALAITAAPGSSTVDPGKTTTLTATASGGATPYTYTWSAANGHISASGASATYTAPGVAGSDTASVVVKDASGQTASYSLPLTIGSAGAPSSQGCTGGSLVDQALNAVSSHTALAVTMGWGSANLGTLSGSIDCNAGTGTISFSNGSFSLGPSLLTGTALSGKITLGTNASPKVCLTGGSLALPASWGLQPATVPTSQPLCLDANALSGSPGGFLSGTLTFPGAPFLPFASGSGGSAPQTTLTLNGSSITVSASGTLLGGSATLTGSYSASTGTTTLNASLTNGKALGMTLGQISGSLTVPSSGAPTYNLSVSATGTANLAPGVTIESATLELDNNGLAVTATAQVGPSGKSVAVGLNGTFTDTSHWALNLTGNQQASCSSWSGTSANLDCLQFLGTVKNTGNGPVFSATASLSSWAVTSFLTVSNLTVQLANDTPPAACTPPASPSNQTPTSVIGSGDVYLAVTGSGTLSLPGVASMPISGAACVDLGGNAGDFLIDAHAADWQPVAGVDATLVSADFDVEQQSGTLTLAGTGQANIAGVSLAAAVDYNTATDDFIVDGYGSLGSLLPSLSGSAHAIFSTGAVSDYKLAEPGSSTSDGTVDLAANSLTVAIDFALPNPADPNSGPVGTVLKKIGITGPTSVVVAAQISSAGFTLIGSLQTQAYLFGLCKGTNGNVNITLSPTQQCLYLQLRDLFVELSSDGTIGFGADTILNIPGSSSTQPPADLDLRMEMAVQLPAKVTASFEVKGEPTDHSPQGCSPSSNSYTDATGEWCNALFVSGLDINTFAIQGSIDFSTVIPTPNIGIYASKIILPTKINNLLGIQSDGETMTFGLNVSATSPVLDIELGQPNGKPFLEPLDAIAGASSAIQVDDADFVFAPFGGQIGGVQVPIGLGLSFDADFFGDVVHASAQVGLSPTPSVTASVYVAALPLPQFGVVVLNADLELGFGANISPPPSQSSSTLAPCASSVNDAVPHGHSFTGFYFAGSGSVGLIPGAPSACLGLGVQVGANGVRLAGGGSVDNWNIGSAIGITHLGMSMSAGPIALGSDTLDSSVDDLVPSVQVTASGSATFLGTTATLQGNLSFGASGITAANLTLSAQPVSYDGLQIGADQTASCPSIVSGPNLGTASASGGPFVQVDYSNSGTWAAAFSGSIGFDGVSASGCGEMSNAGVDFDGQLDLSRIANTKVNVSGAFYWGTPAQGQLVVDDDQCTTAFQTCKHGWQEQQAQQGDWYLSMSAASNMTLGGVAFTGSFGAGSVGGSLYLHGDGSLSVGSQTNGAQLYGLLEASDTGGSLTYELDAAGKVVLDGYTVSEVAASLTPQRFALAGRVTIGGTSIDAAGTIAVGSGQLSASCSFTSSIPDSVSYTVDPNGDAGYAFGGGTAFCFYAKVSNLSFFGGQVNGSAVLSNGGFTLSGSYNFPLGVGNVTVNGGVYADGTLAASLTTGFSLFGSTVNGTVGLCAGNYCSADAGVSTGVWFDANASVSGVGTVTVSGSFTSPSSFSLTASLDNQGGTLGPVNALDLVLVGGTLSYDVTGTIDQNGFHLGDSNVNVSAWYETPTISISWSGVSTGWSDPNTLGSIGVTYSNDQVCLSGSIAGIVTVPKPNICA